MAEAETSWMASHPDALVGRTLPGGFRIVRHVARGGMGLVYEAVREEDGRHVAIKLLSPELCSNPAALQRFRREAQIVSALDHPNIVQYLDVGQTEDGQPFVVLELLAGAGLDVRLNESGAFTVGRAVRIALQAAAALSAAHAAGVVHRDLKPENLFVSDRDEVKILDFGVSKFFGPLLESGTKTGELLGTPNYMAPEQVHDARSATEATDVYGLGALVYEMLTRRPPFVGTSVPVLLVQIMVESPPPLASLRADAPPAFVQVVERALAKNSSDRWPTMAAFAEALQPFASVEDAPLVRPESSALGDTPVIAPPTPAPTPRLSALPGESGKNHYALWMMAVAALLVFGGLALTLKQSNNPAAAVSSVALVTLSVETDSPHAQMRVYGRTYDLPFRGEVEKSAAPVPIEISAPGRESRVLEVRLDDTREIRIQLSKKHEKTL